MQARPPHILITNYSMLEFLLRARLDSAFFDGPTGRHWKLLALDEAHVYDGADGAEIALLLRRVRDRVVRSEPGRLRCLATSATLGGPDDYPTLAAFGRDLFGERFEWEPDDLARQDVIGSHRLSLVRADGAYELPAATYGRLAPLLAGSDGAAMSALTRSSPRTARRPPRGSTGLVPSARHSKPSSPRTPESRGSRSTSKRLRSSFQMRRAAFGDPSRRKCSSTCRARGRRPARRG